MKSNKERLDYDHYKVKQLAPIADGVLQFLGTDFNALTDAQLDFFSVRPKVRAFAKLCASTPAAPPPGLTHVFSARKLSLEAGADFS